ncbi:YicC/YloC family endoribonuclease [Salsuginibacillus kocurii]|uniref:YicC/YloC family endoribonuclease n=1 Tax=Salsuginibacillus kocurii TaxID=427078 RepID=UPI00037D0147|nr:YicC/YloC family endoribonuclease [Salsuginibacillus kocurii]
MLTSMTGYGYATASYGNARVQIEIKSVNHRYCDVQFRMPRRFNGIEEEAKRRIQSHCKRGKIDVYVAASDDAKADKTVQLDWPLIHQYMKAADELKQYGEFEGSLPIESVLFSPELTTIQEDLSLTEESRIAFLQALEEALESLNTMRTREGEALTEALLQEVEEFSYHTKELERLSPKVVVSYREKLHALLKEWKIESREEELERLRLEVFLYADKVNIEEEITRLQAHIGQFRTTVDQAGVAGRKLEFILQEMHREINTVGSKANDAAMSAHVVEGKSLLEKMKEQIQNIC